MPSRASLLGLLDDVPCCPRRAPGIPFKSAFCRVLSPLPAVLLDAMMDGELMGGHAAAILPAVAFLMTVVGLLAALGPARHGLAIQPTEALREE